MWSQGYECIASPCSYVEHYSHANNHVRSNNLSRQKTDWDNYISKWQKISGMKDVTHGQGWLTQKYVDDSRTGRGFLKARGVMLSIVKGRITAIIRHVLRF
jgi:hypothetical protein